MFWELGWETFQPLREERKESERERGERERGERKGMMKEMAGTEQR